MLKLSTLLSMGLVWMMVYPLNGYPFAREISRGVLAFWPNAEATLNLQVGCPQTPLTFWGPCWTDTVIDAATHWQSPETSFRFRMRSPSVTADPCPETPEGDGIYTLAFRATKCGAGFGSALAVTSFFLDPTTGAFVDVDTVFDSKRIWSTYPGPLQTNPAGAIVYDFHRIAIHELGHVLGLDHPDNFGQNVRAIMNSRVSDIDTTQLDDLAGVRAIYPATTVNVQGVLENPQPGSAVSGISTISGWVCSASLITLVIDGTTTIQAAYGTPRSDTRTICGDENNGFGLLVNWNNLQRGTHEIVAFADGVEFSRATVTANNLGVDFLRGASGSYIVPFNGRNVTLKWEESLQNFVISGVQ
ncbi:MAG: matrixin family metalloprotease [Candidatus Binatia bacterium]